ncbi:metallophosphoesterase [Thalassomonas haliotis]|uniref:Metallophosphoesterase n=1 Tax=Thalassomonas haliotis TaxID=485448 RepID=A0ABY7V956_9GAMM|nr:metallophosphoesterase [Thalassomonas haliotis]WDE09831.1 metallophosphoesterase [Thalassomonas haliotis]
MKHTTRSVFLSLLSTLTALQACSYQGEQTTAAGQSPRQTTGNISFLAFGDGGYHVDYPKLKHIQQPRNKAEFIAKEKQDWLEEHRPLAEFDHAPIYVYPGTNIATEQGGAGAVGQAMAKLCGQRACDFGIQLGDNVYPSGADAGDGRDDQKRMDDLILKPLLPLFKQAPGLVIYSALGNHDWKSSRKGVALQSKWMSNQKNFHLDPRGYYRYRVGEPEQDIEFFVLDTNMLLSGQSFYELPLNPDGSEMALSQALANGSAELEEVEPHESPVKGEDKKQLAWLEQGLANSTAKWKIVYGHHILWSVGGTKYSEGHVLRRLILPSLCRYADAYIAGHEHDLELLSDDCSLYSSNNETRNKPPLPLIISGAAAKMRGKHTPFAEQQEQRYPQYELLWSKSFVWGFAHIQVDNQAERLSVEFFTTPRDQSAELLSQGRFSFEHRSDSLQR